MKVLRMLHLKSQQIILYFWIILIAGNTIPTQAQNVLFGAIDSTQLPGILSHPQDELLLDNCQEPDKWNNVRHGLNAAVASTNDVFFRTEVPNSDRIYTEFKTTAWRGERINLELLVWSRDTLAQVNLELNDLRSSDDSVITKNNFQAYLVRYVVSNFPHNSNEYICGIGPKQAGYLLPDRFEEFHNFDLLGKTVRPIWISIDIPNDAEADLYKSVIRITSENEAINIPIEVQIQNQILPPPNEWKYRLDLWQNPWVIANYFNVKPWSEEFKLLLKNHLQLYADAGGKYITTYAVHSPWADNSYYIEKSMIVWIKQKDGNWRFDYKFFDEYVELAHSVGISEAITVYTLLPWADRFFYYDEETNRIIADHWSASSDIYNKNINVFLTDLKKHLQQKGWFNKTFLGINENELPQTLKAIEIIKENSPDWKITYAGYWHSELDSLLDDYSCQFAFEPDAENIPERVSKNQFTTIYVCCIPAKPNNFIFSPQIEGRWLSWYIDAKSYSGFLRWALDSWPSDPNRDARHIYWPAGDSYLIYPGGNSCIRFEKLREGIVDFEKIKIVESLTRSSDDIEIKNLWLEFESNRRKILMEKEYNKMDLEAMVNEGVRLIIKLSNRLK